MSEATPVGLCRIHGGPSRLTFEHVPPRAAFNNAKVRIARLDHNMKGDPLDPSHVQGPESQRGFGFYSLCGPCNSMLGRWYVNEYVRFAKQADQLLMRAWNDKREELPLFCRIRPLLVIKQVLAMFMAVSHERIASAFPGLRELLLDRTRAGLNPEYRVFAYLNRTTDRSRANGPQGIFRGNDVFAVLEVAHYPLGFLMTSGDGILDPSLLDVSWFASCSYIEERSLALLLPVKQIHAWVPGDYRPAEQIQREAAINRAIPWIERV